MAGGEIAETKRTGIVRVGPAGWAYKDWSGIVYPKRRTKGFHEASFLADYFNTIELNVTFYRPISAATATEWVARIAHNPEFLFTAKLWREFTHTRDLSAANEDAFLPAVDALHGAGRLGALLAQFPWSFKHTAENLAYLDKLIDRFRTFPVVVEVRHSSWDQSDVYAWLAERKVGFCNIDQPIIGSSLKPGGKITGPIGYVRLHGRNYDEWFKEREDGKGSEQRYNYLYEEKELEPWAERIETVSETASSTFVITNNHYLGKGVVNALQLIHLLTKKPVAAPGTLIEHYPELKPIAYDSESAASLFPR